MELVLYSDFNCPFCYALGELLRGRVTSARVEWRGVQHAPELPVPMQPAGHALVAELDREVAAVCRLAPRLPIRPPEGKPNTRLAILTVAAAMAEDAGTAAQLRDDVYGALWTEGEDLSDPVVLAGLTRKRGLTGLDAESQRPRAAEWQRSWRTSGVGAVPAPVREDGAVLAGLVSPDAVLTFAGGVSATG